MEYHNTKEPITINDNTVLHPYEFKEYPNKIANGCVGYSNGSDKFSIFLDEDGIPKLKMSLKAEMFQYNEPDEEDLYKIDFNSITKKFKIFE